MKKRRRSDRRKYQAARDFPSYSYTFSRTYRHHMAMYDRETRWYGQESCLPLPGRVLHVTGNSYRWEKS